MAIATKKYLEAIKIYPDLKGKKPLEVYGKLADKGYEWNSFDSRWELETDKAEIPIININIKVQNELADDALEMVRAALEEYGLTILKETRPYPSKERDSKDKLVNSKTHSNAYIQVIFPDGSEDSHEPEIDVEDEE
jgi:hypothetical protein